MVQDTSFLMSRFENLLHDTDDKVRMEAPEIFRVLGKRRPEFVKPYLEQLRKKRKLPEAFLRLLSYLPQEDLETRPIMTHSIMV